MKTPIAFVLANAIAASSAFATSQYPDKIVYGGKVYALHTNPMESYFAKHPEKRPKREIVCTGLWRGYVATFEVKAKEIYLKDIHIEVRKSEHRTAWKSVIHDVVPEGKTLKIDWFTGILVLPHGKLVRYVHMGYGSAYSNYILLEVKRGKITGKRSLDCEQYQRFKERQFQAFKKTEEYRKLVKSLKRKGDSQGFIDAPIRNVVVEYTSRFLDEEDVAKKARNDGKK